VIIPILGQLRVSREKVGTIFSQKRCDNKQIEQDGASELAHLALANKSGAKPNISTVKEDKRHS
jgi:hypothetical protein